MAAHTPIRLGVIGLSPSAWWAPVLLSSVLPPSGAHAAKYRITAICTTNQTSAEAAAVKFGALYPAGGPAITPYWGTEGYKGIADDANVDMVLAVVNVKDHKAVIWPTLERGKNAFVEWPLGKGLKETEELAALAKSRGVKIAAVGAQAIQNPMVRKLAEVVKSGEIGRVVSTTVIANCIKELGYWGPWVLGTGAVLKDKDGGASFLDIAVGHFLAAFTFVLGDIVSVSATMATRFSKFQSISGAFQAPTSEETHERTAEDQIAVSGVLASGVVFSFHYRSGLSAQNEGQKPFLWLIDGEAGTARFEDDVPAGASFVHIKHPKMYVKGVEQTFTEPLVDYTGCVGGEWEEIAKGEKGSFSTFEDAVRIHRVLEAIRTSAKEGRRVDLK